MASLQITLDTLGTGVIEEPVETVQHLIPHKSVSSSRRDAVPLRSRWDAVPLRSSRWLSLVVVSGLMLSVC